MEMVSSNCTRLRPSPSEVTDTSAPFETTKRFSSISTVTEKTAFMSGSSKQGKARRASVDSKCVVAIHWSTPSGSVKRLR